MLSFVRDRALQAMHSKDLRWWCSVLLCQSHPGWKQDLRNLPSECSWWCDRALRPRMYGGVREFHSHHASHPMKCGRTCVSLRRQCSCPAMSYQHPEDHKGRWWDSSSRRAIAIRPCIPEFAPSPFPYRSDPCRELSVRVLGQCHLPYIRSTAGWPSSADSSVVRCIQVPADWACPICRVPCRMSFPHPLPISGSLPSPSVPSVPVSLHRCPIPPWCF